MTRAVVTLWRGGANEDGRLADGLARAGWQVELRGPDAVVPAGSAGALVVEEGEHALATCRALRAQLGEEFRPLVYVAERDWNRGLEAGADLAFPKQGDPADLAAQLLAAHRLRSRHDRLAGQAAEAQRVNVRLQDAYHQISRELDLARRIQASFLPQSLPESPHLRFAVEYRPCGQVGGDFYDVFRLDEHTYGFYVADAMGHGMGASLLTIFVKKSVRPKEIHGNAYRVVPPNEVLHRLNLEFINQALSDTPFITIVYGLFDVRRALLTFSRAGHPHPVHLPRAGPPQPWKLDGSLLGVFATQYQLRAQTLERGDKVLIHTDAIDSAVFDGHPPGLPSLYAALEAFRDLSVDALVKRLASDLFAGAPPGDDLTLFAMEAT